VGSMTLGQSSLTTKISISINIYDCQVENSGKTRVGHYTKKFGLITSRTPNEARAERVVALTKIVRSEKAPRTGEYASNPERKTLLAFLIWRGWIFSEKGKGVFLSGFCPPSIRAVRGASIRTRQSENLFFWGFGLFALPRLISRAEEGSGEESARVSFSDFWRTRAKINNGLWDQNLIYLFHKYLI